MYKCFVVWHFFRLLLLFGNCENALAFQSINAAYAYYKLDFTTESSFRTGGNLKAKCTAEKKLPNRANGAKNI